MVWLKVCCLGSWGNQAISDSTTGDLLPMKSEQGSVLSVVFSITTERGSRVTGKGRVGGRFARREGMGGFSRGSV